MEKWKKLDREYIVDNRWVKLAKDTVQLPNGAIMDDFYVFEKKNVSIIVALDESNRVLIKKEYRYPVDEFLYELPGGVIEAEAGGQSEDTEAEVQSGETEALHRSGAAVGKNVNDELLALETAKRELLEETGYESDDWTKLLTGYDYPTKDTNAVNIFLARNIRKVGEQKLEVSEDIEFEFIPLDEAIEMCITNKIKVNGTIAGLLLTEKRIKAAN